MAGLVGGFDTEGLGKNWELLASPWATSDALACIHKINQVSHSLTFIIFETRDQTLNPLNSWRLSTARMADHVGMAAR